MQVFQVIFFRLSFASGPSQIGVRNSNKKLFINKNRIVLKIGKIFIRKSFFYCLSSFFYRSNEFFTDG
jgi:hypothetical protein